MMIRTYSELCSIEGFEQRYEYLKLNGKIGFDTFGFDRYLNQIFYKSIAWRNIRNEIIIRDGACDLGVDGYTIDKHIIIHHMNPINKKDIMNISEYLLNKEYLICTSHKTHNAIHYGAVLYKEPFMVKRFNNDTCPWKK